MRTGKGAFDRERDSTSPLARRRRRCRRRTFPPKQRKKLTSFLSLPFTSKKTLGFSHAAFVFGYESLVHRGREPGGGVPPGALVSFVQKGLQYLELEANVAEDPSGNGPAVRGDFAALTASDLITKDVEELKRAVAERRERGGGAGGGAGPATAGGGGGSGGGLDGPAVPDAAVTRLEGHSSEVFTVAWSPSGSALATGSGDGTARLWSVGSGGGGGGAGAAAAAGDGGGGSSAAPAVLSASFILRHTAQGTASTAAAPAAAPGDKSRDVTTLDWSPDGTLLATGSYDGVARLWSAADGSLVRSLARHSGPIFSLKWAKSNSSGGSSAPRLLLSGSVDKRAIVWNADSGEVKQEFECHTGKEDGTFFGTFFPSILFRPLLAFSQIYSSKNKKKQPRPSTSTGGTQPPSPPRPPTVPFASAGSGAIAKEVEREEARQQRQQQRQQQRKRKT